MNVKKIINATPDEVRILNMDEVTYDFQLDEGTANPEMTTTVAVFEPSGIIASVKAQEYICARNGEVIIDAIKYGAIENLPYIGEESVFYIVSELVASAGEQWGRFDLLTPSKLIKDEFNPSHILGCLVLRSRV